MSTMTANRRFTLSTHGVIELVLGLGTLVSPALLGFGGGGIVAAVVLGSLITGMAVTLGADDRSSLGWHHVLDLVLVIASALAALALAVSGDASAGLFFSALAVLESGLNVTTRYVVAS